jgi:hypothetical protein
MPKPRTLKIFVKRTLGCACPDEVFENIEYFSGSSPDVSGIILGNRLLLFLWKTDDPADIATDTVKLLQSGKLERDRRSLNRFRLVIATDHVEKIKPKADHLFKAIHSQMDEKIHLHVVHKKNLPQL